MKTKDLLALPDAEAMLPPEFQHTVGFWRSEIVYLYQPHHVLFKQMPPGNLRPTNATASHHIIIDIGLLAIDAVHELLRRHGNLDCQLRPGTVTGCNCSRELLLQLTLDALGAQPRSDKDKLQRQVFKRYMSVTAGSVQNLPATGQTPAASSAPRPPLSLQSASPREKPDVSGGSTKQADACNPKGYLAGSPATGNHLSPEDLRIMSELDLQKAIDSMLTGSAQEQSELQAASSQDREPIFQQANQETRDTSTLHKSTIQLDCSMQHPDARLFLPIDAQGRRLIDASTLPVHQIQGLFALLVELHQLFSTRQQLTSCHPFMPMGNLKLM